MTSFRHYIVYIAVAVLLFTAPLISHAATIAELQTQIQSLLAQVAALQAQSNVAAPQSGAASCLNLTEYRGQA